MPETMGVQIVRGTEADRLLSDPAFASAWASLLADCAWATAFQSHAFAATWYHAYREQFEPVLLIGRDPNGQLDGLLPLAFGRGRLIVAGDRQAEYHAWICRSSLAATFPVETFDVLRRAFPTASLQFRYMPAGIPLDWMRSHAGHDRVRLESFRRPLMQLGDGSEVEDSLRKSGNKSRLRQLKKFGPIELVRVTDPAEFEPLLDQLTLAHDCRQLAIHGCAPFEADACKRAFHLAMMREPGLLHVTALKVGGRPISFQLNVTRGRELQLYLIAHDPAFSGYSPGKLHILLMARMLVGEGFEQIDLTPGGDAYKERFANGGDEVRRLTIYPSIVRRNMARITRGVERFVRNHLAQYELTAADVRGFARDVRARGVQGITAAATRAIVRAMRWPSVAGLYACDASPDNGADVEPSVHRDDLADLLSYRPIPGQPSRRRFVSGALRRLEAGQHLYTMRVGGRLTGWAWLAPASAAKSIPSPRAGTSIPPGAAVIDGLQLPSHCGAVRLLRQAARDASDGSVIRIFLVAPADPTWARLVSQVDFAPAEGELVSTPSDSTTPNAAAPTETAEPRQVSEHPRRSHAA